MKKPQQITSLMVRASDSLSLEKRLSSECFKENMPYFITVFRLLLRYGVINGEKINIKSLTMCQIKKST